MCSRVQRDAKTIFQDTFCIHRVRGVCPYLPSILIEYPVYLGVTKHPTLSDKIHGKSDALCQSFIYISNKQVLPTLGILYDVLFNKLGWGNSGFKIEGRGGPSYLKQTTDSEFPQTFDVIP